MPWTLQIVELSLEVQGKACSRCQTVKPLADFYKQGTRHESFCKTCKRNSRESRNVSVEQLPLAAASPTKANQKTVEAKYNSRKSEREVMPTFDESIFYPEEARRSLGINDDDMDSLIAYFRWQLEQREKRKKQEEKL
jgi:hypothetical protein